MFLSQWGVHAGAHHDQHPVCRCQNCKRNQESRAHLELPCAWPQAWYLHAQSATIITNGHETGQIAANSHGSDTAGTLGYVHTWEQLIANRATIVDQLWDCWTLLAEETMLLLSLATTPHVRKGICQLPLARGRGTSKMLKHVSMTPNRMLSTGPPCTTPMKEMSAIVVIPQWIDT